MQNHPNLNHTQKEHLLILHGALGARDQFTQLASELSKNYSVHLLDFPGHGCEPLGKYDFSIHSFSEYVIDYCSTRGIVTPSVFGYSMGGYVAMYIAKKYPVQLNRIITLATKYRWDEQTAIKESRMLEATVIREKVPAFAAQLEARHGKVEWIRLLQQTSGLLLSLGREHLLPAEGSSIIQNHCLLMLGDRDKMVSLDETLAIYKSLPNGQLAILPGTHHPIEQVDAVLLNMFIHRFLSH